LQHITTETQFDSLSSGSKEEMAQKLYEFWKMRDPSPETAYNEQMAEFYKRADYAYFNFAKSPRQLDGAMTDRGKVYILYGPPTNVERSFLLGEEPTEIWTYMNKVRKIFKFTDDSGRGDYKLVQIKSM
jgi:GWxTD domain-containing protein